MLQVRTLTHGLSQAAVNLASLTITFGGTIGTESTPLAIAVSGTLKVSSTSSRISISAGGTNPIVKAQIVNIGGTFYASGGTYTTIELGNRGGQFIADTSCVVTTLRGTGMSAKIGYNATRNNHAGLAWWRDSL